MRKFNMILLFLWFTMMASGQYITPGTGVNWNLEQFVSNSGGIISFDGSVYDISGNITISANDIISINEPAYFRVSSSVLITVNGNLIITAQEPPVIFASTDQQNHFTGFKFQNSPGSNFSNVQFFRAGGIKILSSNIEFNGCVFEEFNQSNCTGVLDLSQSSPVISSCGFFQNAGPAVLSSANGASSPQIFNCTMVGNVTTNANMPQINLGTSATDSIRIVGNQIIGNPALLQVGGIAITTLAGGVLTARIEGNLIKNNRYGMTQYGNNIGSVIRNNIIEDNNTQGLPNLGGSGINFFGNTTNQSYVSGNTITGNLWGITIQNSAQPNFGQLDLGDLSPGMNQFFGNGNEGEIFDLYNNTPLTIWAQNNYWGTMDIDSVEMHIFHQPDDPTLGLVHYLPMLDPTVDVTEFNFEDPLQLSVSIYPNPAKDKINIIGLSQQEQTNIELFTPNGRLVRSWLMETSEEKLDISNLPPGIYFLVINTRESHITRKLIID